MERRSRPDLSSPSSRNDLDLFPSWDFKSSSDTLELTDISIPTSGAVKVSLAIYNGDGQGRGNRKLNHSDPFPFLPSPFIPPSLASVRSLTHLQ